VDKKALSEQDICTKFITPAITQAGWDVQSQIRQEVRLTDGRLQVKGNKVKRAPSKRADYVLYYQPNVPLAVVEAKDNKHSIGAGMQQALGYANMLDVPFVFSSNGDGFLFHDNTRATLDTATNSAGDVEQALSLDAFPSPDELWQRYCDYNDLQNVQAMIAAQPYYDPGEGKSPRYYQQVAINKTVQAIAKGQDRIMLVMATGTGKTYTAFQIIWRLWKAGAKKRILFLADRNILVDQAKVNDFSPFGDAMTKISNREVEKSYEIYLALYQGITGTEDAQNIYKQFSPGFFDLIVIDECHRGSAAEDSAWREVLTYYDSATHLGLTATPKETETVSNTDYFGEPIYTYSLRQGIDDGFLAPYKVVRIDLDKDLSGWTPSEGQRDKHGNLIDERTYNQSDFDRDLVLTERTRTVARYVSDFLKKTDRMDKTIIFCENIDHAERMRQALVNENADKVDASSKYVMRITGDNAEGKAELDNFIKPWEAYPVIVTTSKLMTTGVDAQTCKLIVLDRVIKSMTEFKQIIGRGTRINDNYGKHYFTIMDFKRATVLFRDPDFDGDPVQIYEPREGEDPVPPEDGSSNVGEGNTGEATGEGNTGEDDPGTTTSPRQKFVVDDVAVSVSRERVEYLNAEGELVTESMKDYTRKTVNKEYASLDAFLATWSSSDKKQAIIDALADRGIVFEWVAEEANLDNHDPFDIICHVAFDQPPLTRRERAAQVRKRDDVFSKYGEQARAVIAALLDKYEDEGISAIEDISVLRVQPFNDLGTPVELVKLFGSKQAYQQAVRELESQLYSTAA
jgi:type I restriction enzyme R subunit